MGLEENGKWDILKTKKSGRETSKNMQIEFSAAVLQSTPFRAVFMRPPGGSRPNLSAAVSSCKKSRTGNRDKKQKQHTRFRNRHMFRELHTINDL